MCQPCFSGLKVGVCDIPQGEGHMGGLGECCLEGLGHLVACRVWVGPYVDVVVAFEEFGPKVLPRGGAG
ncbi:hypothetical protein [Propionibacterium phage TCUCAP1]|nr:hypothetical protein [Propionibacterium phage TCUCAP1]